LQNRRPALSGSLQEQFAAVKDKRAAGTFHHSGAETGFELSGRHLKAECSACHTKPLTGSAEHRRARASIVTAGMTFTMDGGPTVRNVARRTGRPSSSDGVKWPAREICVRSD
jgi:hypothetical protein